MKRLGLAVGPQTIEEYFLSHIGAITYSQPLVKYYNGSFNSPLPVLIGYPQPVMKLLRWGLIPSIWSSKNFPANMYHASTNGIIRHRFHKAPIRNQRCIVPASYYITWKGKQPYLCFIEQTYLFGIAALYDCWKPKNGESPVYSFSIVMAPANERMQSISDEIPLILRPDNSRSWLSDHTDLSTITRLFHPFNGRTNAYPISDKVNDTGYNQKDIYTPIGRRIHRKFRNIPARVEKDRRGREKVVEWKREYLD